MQRHEAEDHYHDNTCLDTDLQSFGPYDITPNSCPDYRYDDENTGNIQNGSIYRLKDIAHKHGVEAKAFCKTNEDDIADQEKGKTPKHKGVSESGKVLTGHAFQTAPLRNNLEQHILDALPYAVESLLLFPQTHKTVEDIQPLRKQTKGDDKQAPEKHITRYTPVGRVNRRHDYLLSVYEAVSYCNTPILLSFLCTSSQVKK